jgi:hypothetical protein
MPKKTHKEILEAKLVEAETSLKDATATMYQNRGAVIVIKQMIEEAK